jgi:ABC-2 type transport system ATP-binding protein
MYGEEVISEDIILNVSDLTKIYGREMFFAGRKFGRRVVGCHDVNFFVRRGEIFGFLGPNGAGKTTAMRSILDYLHIQEGKITLFGLDHHKDSLEIRERIGYIPGDLALYENFTGEELIEYYDGFRAVDQEFLRELQSVFRVDLTLNIKSLSTGNRQQVGLILALASKPDFMILDEPTSGLDPLMTASTHRLFKKLKAEGKTIFLSSHDLAEVQAVCDRIGIIKEGEMILIEEVESLVSKFLQNVRVSFSSDVPPLKSIESIDSVISAEAEDEDTLLLKVREDINELLRFLTNYKLDRLSIEDATLEEIFLQYYK